MMQARNEALKKKAFIYEGAPCPHCKKTKRYTATSRCVHCRIVRNAKSVERKRQHRLRPITKLEDPAIKMAGVKYEDDLRIAANIYL